MICRLRYLASPMVTAALIIAACESTHESSSTPEVLASDTRETVPEIEGQVGFRIDGEPVCVSNLPTVEMRTAVPPRVEAGRWRSLGPGVDYTTLTTSTSPSSSDATFHVVRVAPEMARLRLLSVTVEGGEARTAGAWCDEEHLLAAINAGMYQSDLVTHTGYLRIGASVNSDSWTKRYNSLLLLDPARPGLAPATLVDLDDPGSRKLSLSYATVAQNLRLIRGNGRSTWNNNPRSWSEALIAEDRHGRILLLFSRTPFSMADLNRRLLSSPLEIVRAMHAEGGPEASLSVRADGLSLDLAGSFETGFNENDDNRQQWPLPNVLGVTARENHR